MGGAMCKLLFRTLPQYYPEGSIYAQCVLPFPFLYPSNDLISPQFPLHHPERDGKAPPKDGHPQAI